MNTPIQSEDFSELNGAWLGGENIAPLKFLHNCIVEACLPDKSTATGWIVAANINGAEPVYTVETQDGSGDIQCPESKLTLIEE